MELETNLTTLELNPLVDVLLLDRDGHRCTERLTALARSCGVGAAASADSIAAWLSRAGQTSPDVLVMSADTFNEAEVAEAIQWLGQSHPNARFVLADVPATADRSVQHLELGAWSCLARGAPAAELLECIFDAARGRVRLTGDQLGQVMLRLRELTLLRPSYLEGDRTLGGSSLTQREREILGLMAARMSNREIAARLSLEVGTVKNHVHSVLKKMSLRNRQEAVYAGSGRTAPALSLGPWSR